MAPYGENLLDDIGWQILHVLMVDASLSYREVGERIGLTGAAVGERVKKMMEAGIIREIRAEPNFSKLGLHITAFIKVSATGEDMLKLKKSLPSLPAILEAHEVVGGESLILKVVLPSLPALQALRDDLSSYGPVHASIVLDSIHYKRDLRDR